MTIIAWDGKTLAADKRATYSGLARTVTKISRTHKGELVAFSGDFDMGVALVQWYVGDGYAERYPNNKDNNGIMKTQMMVIRLDGTICIYEREPVPMTFTDPQTAMGSGRDYAMAAMHLGCTAVQAVQVACDLDIFCGNGIDTLQLNDPDHG